MSETIIYPPVTFVRVEVKLANGTIIVIEGDNVAAVLETMKDYPEIGLK